MAAIISFLVLLLGLAAPALSQYVYAYDADRGPPPQSNLFDPSKYEFKPPSALSTRAPPARPQPDDEDDDEDEPRIRNQQPARHYVPPPRPTFSVPAATQRPIVYRQPLPTTRRPRIRTTTPPPPPPPEEEVEYVYEDPEENVNYVPPVVQTRTPAPQTVRRKPVQEPYRPPIQQVQYLPEVREPVTYRPPVEVISYTPPSAVRTAPPQPVTFQSPPIQHFVNEPITYRPPPPPQAPPPRIQQRQPIAYRPPAEATYRPSRRTTTTPRPQPLPPPTTPSNEVQIIEITAEQLRNIETVDGKQFIVLPNGQRFQLLSQPSQELFTTPRAPPPPPPPPPTTTTTTTTTTTRRPPPPPLPPTTTAPQQQGIQIIEITADQLRNIEVIDGKQYIVMPNGQRFQLLSQPELQPQYTDQNAQPAPTSPPVLGRTHTPSTAIAFVPRATTPLPPVYQPPVQYEPPVAVQTQIAPPTPAQIQYQPPPPTRRRRPSRKRTRTTTQPPPPPPRDYVPDQASATIRRSPIANPTEAPSSRPRTYKPSNIAVAALPPDSDGDGIPGQAGVDYPTLNEIPETSFSCARQPIGGYYADLETACQLVHFCQAGGVGHSFLCPNGTIFNQEKFSCQWWYKVNCATASQYYALNDKLYKVPSTTAAPGRRENERRRRQRRQQIVYK